MGSPTPPAGSELETACGWQPNSRVGVGGPWNQQPGPQALLEATRVTALPSALGLTTGADHWSGRVFWVSLESVRTLGREMAQLAQARLSTGDHTETRTPVNRLGP